MLSARDFYARAWTSRLDIYRRYSLQEESDSEQSDGSRSRKVKKYANQNDVREPPPPTSVLVTCWDLYKVA